MSLIHEVEWNKIFEFTWRILVFVVAIAIIVIVSTNWTRWEGGEGWQRTNDAYLQSDLTAISAKVTGYIRRASRARLWKECAGDKCWRAWSTMTTAPPSQPLKRTSWAPRHSMVRCKHSTSCNSPMSRVCSCRIDHCLA